MATGKSRLGRGLSGLISGGSSQKGNAAPARAGTRKTAGKSQSASAGKSKAGGAKSKPARPQPNPVAAKAPDMPGFCEVDITAIDSNPYQPRREFDEEGLKELADSIRAEGLLQPIVVRKVGEKFQLIAGERRWRACKLVGLKRMPVRLIDAGDASAASMSLIENLQRANLNPLEESLGYASLMRDFDLTQEEVAERVGKGRATVANALRLIHLNRELQGYLSKGLITTGHAKLLLGLEGEQEQIVLARRIIEEGLSVRAVEKLVKNFKIRTTSGNGERPAGATPESSAVRDIEKQLASCLNTRVALKHSPKKGKIVIEYYGNDDLQRILEKIGISG